MNNKLELEIRGKVYQLEEKEVNIDELLFNPYNTRIHSISNKIWNDRKDEEVDSYEYLTSKEVQEKLYKGFVKMYKNSTDYSKLKKSILSTKGLVKEKRIYITEDNLVLSGNTRLSILKKLKEENIKGIDFNVNVYVIKGEIKVKSIIDDIEYHLQTFAEEKVEYETFQKWMKIHSMSTDNGKSIDELSQQYSIEADEISNIISTINEYYQFLINLDNKDYKELYRELDLSSALQFIAKDLPKKKNIEIRLAAKELVLNSILAGFNWNKIRTVINTYIGIKSNNCTVENKVEFLNSVNEEMLFKTGKTVEYTKELVKSSKPIKDDEERKILIGDFSEKYGDPSIIISGMQVEATDVKNSFDSSEEEIRKAEIKKIGASIRKLKKLDKEKSEDLDFYYKELINILRDKNE